MITITHTRMGVSKTFDKPRDAAAFIDKCLASKKMKMKDLTIDNRSGVSLSIYTDRIPEWHQTLIETLERDWNANVPQWHFIDKHLDPNNIYSVGHTWYTKEDHKTTHISITRGRSDLDLAGVIIHEYAHALTPHDNHGRAFYRMMFRLLRTYLTYEQEIKIVERENRYKKSSRYWYGEMYQIAGILDSYRPVAKVATYRPSKEEISKKIIDGLFEDMK